jgi:hypothetical protein
MKKVLYLVAMGVKAAYRSGRGIVDSGARSSYSAPACRWARPTIGAAEPSAAQLDAHFGVAESLANPNAMADLGAGWTRVLLAWHHIQPSNATDYWGFGRVLREKRE